MDEKELSPEIQQELESNESVTMAHKLYKKDIDMICHHLKKNNKMMMLYISGNSLDSRLCMLLFNVAKGHKNLKNISAWGNDMGNIDAVNHGRKSSEEEEEAIGRLLEYNETLKTIDLSTNGIGPTMTKWICKGMINNGCLKSLHLSHNCIGPEGAVYIGEMLAVNNTLEDIGLSHNCIGNKGLALICHGIAHNTALKVIDVDMNGITDTDAFVDMIRANNTLTIVSMRYNSIGDDGVVRICEALAQNKTITFINIENNKIGSIGAKAVGCMLGTNKKVETMGLANNNICSNGIGYIVEGLSKNFTLDILHIYGNPGEYVSNPRVSQNIMSNYSIEMILDDTNKLLHITRRNESFAKIRMDEMDTKIDKSDNIACIGLEKPALSAALCRIGKQAPHIKTLVISFCDTTELEGVS